MPTKYYKIVIKEPMAVPLTRQDHLTAPNHYIKIEQYHERIIEVDYLLLPDTDPQKFEKLIYKVIRLNYKNIHSISEYFMPDNTKIEQYNEVYGKV
jgi:hypothetical protein